MELEVAPPMQGVAGPPIMPHPTSTNAAAESSKVPNDKATTQKHETSKAHPALLELNSQLYARGLTRGGIKLDGLNSKAQDQVVKVISKLLSQRADDFTQLESMQTSHRVLSHDLDRLTDLHKDLKKRVISAEKERELARSQVATLSQKLKREEDAHKLAREDCSRAQTALTLVRTQAQHDIKKREVQLERTLQHWQRVSSENARLLSAGYRTGLTWLNPIEAPEQAPRVDSLFDPSIRELDHQIISLQEECEAFRHVTLSTANQLLKLEAIAKQEAEPARIDAATFFKAHGTSSTQTSSSTSHPLTADTRIREIMARLRSCIEADASTKEEAERLKKDLLSEMVNSYEGERVERVKELMEQKMQEMVAALENARLGEDGGPLPSSLPPDTRHPVGVVADQAAIAQEKEGLDQDRAAVDAEGKRVTETLVRLAQDRAVFEIERTAFLEERRRFEMEKVMQEPPRQPSNPSNGVSPGASSSPPKTPEKGARNETDPVSNESSRESLLSTSSVEIRISPTKINTRPAISSPLANSTAVRHTAARVRSPLHRRRTTKGPSTPLARFVSHKIVAEKLASAKKSKAVQSTEPTMEVDADVETVRPAARTIQARPPRSTTLTAPTSSSALKSTTKANERHPPSQSTVTKGPPMKRTRSPLEGTQVDTFSAEDAAVPRRLASSTTSRMPPSLNAVRKDIPSTVRPVRRLEVGQGAGIGPRSAAQTATWR